VEARFHEPRVVDVLQYVHYVLPRHRVRTIIQAVTLGGERDNRAIHARAGLN
jgi:hypothetical protein